MFKKYNHPPLFDIMETTDANSLRHKRPGMLPKKSASTRNRRAKSEGQRDRARSSFLKKVVVDLTGRFTDTQQNKEDLQEQTEFPVKPYYNDDPDNSTILIPKGLQVKESK